MIIVLKIKRRELFSRRQRSYKVFWCHALWKPGSSNCMLYFRNESCYGNGKLYKDLLFVYLQPSINKNS